MRRATGPQLAPCTPIALNQGDMTLQWHNLASLTPTQYTCGYCNNLVGPNRGYRAAIGANRIYICSYCERPTYFDGFGLTPGAAYGRIVQHLPDDVEALYGEARECLKVGAATSAVLTARKILMHVAVEKGAEEGLSFVQYVQHLGDEGWVPPDGKGWVDHIRKRSNDANHEIDLMSIEDAERLIDFTGMLLVFAYELPGRIPPGS